MFDDEKLADRRADTGASAHSFREPSPVPEAVRSPTVQSPTTAVLLSSLPRSAAAAAAPNPDASSAVAADAAAPGPADQPYSAAADADASAVGVTEELAAAAARVLPERVLVKPPEKPVVHVARTPSPDPPGLGGEQMWEGT